MVLDGKHAGTTVVLASDAPAFVECFVDWLGEAAELADGPDRRAEALLRSLLTNPQFSQWQLCGSFDVDTEIGHFELGELYDIGYWPERYGRGPEFRLCVVPTVFGDLPKADIWVNLVLALASDPRGFLAVANWRRPQQGQWHPPPIPGFQAD